MSVGIFYEYVTERYIFLLKLTKVFCPRNLEYLVKMVISACSAVWLKNALATGGMRELLMTATKFHI